MQIIDYTILLFSKQFHVANVLHCSGTKQWLNVKKKVHSTMLKNKIPLISSVTFFSRASLHSCPSSCLYKSLKTDLPVLLFAVMKKLSSVASSISTEITVHRSSQAQHKEKVVPRWRWMDGDRSILYLRFTIRGGGGSAGIGWAGKATIEIHMDND